MTTAQDLLKTNYVSVDINDTIASLLGKFTKAKQHFALVFDKNEYMGVVERRFLLTSRINVSEMKVKNVVKKRSKSKTPFYVPELSLLDDAKKICKLMNAADTHALPVLEKGKVVGVVRAWDLVQALASEYKKVTCEQLACLELVTVKENDSISTVINRISKHGIDHIPVVDASGKTVGMIALSDLLENPRIWGAEGQHVPKGASRQPGKRSGYQHGEKTSNMDLPIKNIMSKVNVCCTAPSASIRSAVKLMADGGVCSIILMRNSKAVGILTMKDILADYSKS